MKQKTPKKEKSQRELAEILGISPQLLNFHLKNKNAPELSDVDAWHEFLAANSREGGLPKDIRKKIGVQRHRLIKGQADRVEHENQVRKGLVIDRGNVRHGIQNAMSMLFVELDRIFLSELPPSLVGLEAREIRNVCEGRIEMLRVSLRAKFAAISE